MYPFTIDITVNAPMVLYIPCVCVCVVCVCGVCVCVLCVCVVCVCCVCVLCVCVVCVRVSLSLCTGSFLGLIHWQLEHVFISSTCASKCYTCVCVCVC